MSLYKRILVAIDLSDDALIVLKKAAAIANSNKASLVVLHVIEPMTLSYGANINLEMTSFENELVFNVKKRLNEICEKTGVIEASQRIVQGVPEKEVHSLSRELSIDLIITGNHGRHGLSLILGSTSTAILHGAPCDVFTIKVGKN